jgi:hypothetical protein
MTNFIYEQMIDDLSICDDIIAYHKVSPKIKGAIFRNGETIVDKNTKDAEEVFFEINPVLYTRYMDSLRKVVSGYILKFPYSDHGGEWRVNGKTNIQHYKPNGGYYEWHTERQNATYPEVTRHLVFMTYLNDITDAGETEFFHQKIKVKPKKGLTLIWPADWTHYHRGIPSPTQEKYIVTGWFNYVT